MKIKENFTLEEWDEIAKETGYACYIFVKNMPHEIKKNIIDRAQTAINACKENKILPDLDIKDETFPQILFSLIASGMLRENIEIMVEWGETKIN